MPETDLNAATASVDPFDFVPDYTQWATGQYLQLFTDKRATFDKGGTYGPWPGTIYLLAVYNRVLTSAEIRANYDYGQYLCLHMYLRLYPWQAHSSACVSHIGLLVSQARA